MERSDRGHKKDGGATVVHNRVAVLRAERGLSRRQLAEALGVNYQTIGYIERGEYNPSLELAFRAGEFFGLPIEAIFSREPFRPLSEEVYGARGTAERSDGGDETTTTREGRAR